MDKDRTNHPRSPARESGSEACVSPDTTCPQTVRLLTDPVWLVQ
jgi:hypothetical protein